jgi:hypothetical protein
VYLAANTVHLSLLFARIIMSAQLTAPFMPRPQAPIVKAHPFIASYQDKSPSLPEGMHRGRIYRDSLGRTRTDINLPGGQEMRFIDDVTKSTLFVVDVSRGLYDKDSYQPIDLGWIFPNTTPVVTEEHRDILGIDCVRVRFKPPRSAPVASAGDIGEAWISKPLGIVMKDMNPSLDWKWEVTRIEFREPDPGTFELPPGLRESEK